MTRNFISGAVKVCWDELWAAKDRGSILVTHDIKDTYERDTGEGEWWQTHSEPSYKAAFVSRLLDIFIARQLLCHLWMLNWQRLVSWRLAVNLLISLPSENLTCCSLLPLTHWHFASIHYGRSVLLFQHKNKQSCIKILWNQCWWGNDEVKDFIRYLHEPDSSTEFSYFQTAFHVKI